MNRYSLIFAVLVASSFAVQSPPSRDSNPPGRETGKDAVAQLPAPLNLGPESFINAFLAMAPHGKTGNPQVLFVTVPHPLETHLATTFDNNIDALEDGLQDAGYLFNSALIPWNPHGPRDQYDDDEKERRAKSQEDDAPGVLLFRNRGSGQDRYGDGLIVFLLTEKPTGGIARAQAQNAAAILEHCGISLGTEMRILGPNYSGSFASLVPIVGDLLKAGKQTQRVIIRSGGVSVIREAQWAADALAAKVKVDIGSTNHENREQIELVESTFVHMGIDRWRVALLSEGQSVYGSAPSKTMDGMWSIAFPRDISALRAGYEKQGIFDSSAAAQPLKRFLNLRSEEQGAGDTVRKFGADATTLAQESVLIAISEFLKVHKIGAVIIRATNPEDRQFLTQFLHANNSGVRVAMLGATRAFTRGSTAQFRGDLLVGNFPMLPLLHDWTGREGDGAERIYADELAQGTYFATLDLFKEPTEPVLTPQTPGATPQVPGRQYKWYPEYSEPNWGSNSASEQRPPMYVVALGTNATWPVVEDPGKPVPTSDSGPSGVAMPFTLFGRDQTTKTQAPTPSRPIDVAFSWKILFLIVTVSAALYCAFFWYANPVSRIAFASFAPSLEWRFWLFKVTIPAAVAGCAFRVLAWAVAMPFNASPQAVWWGGAAEWATGLAPFAIAISAAVRALLRVRLTGNDAIPVTFNPKSPARIKMNREWRIPIPFLRKFRVQVEFRRIGWAAVSYLALIFILIAVSFIPICVTGPVAGGDVSAILNIYREMHWESGLSLIPTVLLFLAAILIWASQAGNVAALIDAAPSLPHFFNKGRISQKRADAIQSIGRPLPFNWQARWLWAVWFVFAGLMVWAHFHFRPFREITTLESYAATCLVRGTAGALGALIFLDVCQFFWLWAELRGLLQALDREEFKRSFVPIHDFNWRNLWSVTGTSLSDRRAILSAQVDCVFHLRGEHRFACLATLVETLHNKYSKTDLSDIDSKTYRNDLRHGYRAMAVAAAAALGLIARRRKVAAQKDTLPDAVAIQPALASQSKGDGGRFSDEAEELARLPKWQQTAEKLICLMYIGFIQTIVARLHTLLISVASMFSLITLGLAIYPFVPFSSLLVAGVAFLVLIGCAFFKVFSEMDTDPILSRIVNGDDRTLQGNFYMRFAEAIALPLLALGSSVLPGGAGRLLELAQSVFNHAQ